MTLSSPDLRWNELIHIISNLSEINISENKTNKQTYQECKILNSNSVLVARHFQYRVEVFFKEIVLDGSLGKTKYYAIRVEFQITGSPHIHSFIWILNAPHLTKESKNDYITWVNGIIRADLPISNNETGQYHLVKNYQIQCHSKTCRKYKNQICRFNFEKLFTDHTTVAKPLPSEISLEEKTTIMNKRKVLLQKVNHYIDRELNRASKNIFDNFKDDYNR